ncbi:MAG: MOSC domain-containing protein [Pseudomonadota bacterium]
MPALIATHHAGRIAWLGVVADQDEDIRSAAHGETDLDWDGVPGEFHGGRTRPSCVRVTEQHPEGTEIANVRQLSVVSAEELALIAREMGLDALRPEWLGASVVIEGIDDFTHIPPSSRLQSESGATLVVDMHNRPCNWPGKEIEKDHEGYGRRFRKAGAGRRGVTAWVERPGRLRVGDRVTLHVPDQRAWVHHESCLTGKQT